MILHIIQTIIFGLAAVQGAILGKQFFKSGERKTVSGKNKALFWSMGVVINFFDYLGIGSLAPTMAIYRLTKTVKDELIPGTLVTGCVVPVGVEALVSLSIIEVETLTLFVMYGAGILGAFIGGKVATKLKTNTIRKFMGCALLIASLLMIMSKFGFMPLGGEALGLHGVKLVIGAAGSFILASLLTVGIGNYAPTMCLVYMLGMSPAVSFPIMMGLGFLGTAGGSFPYFEEERYNKYAAFAFCFGGIPGVIIAAFLVKSMPLGVLQWLVIIVCIYTGISLLKQAFSDKAAE